MSADRPASSPLDGLTLSPGEMSLGGLVVETPGPTERQQAARDFVRRHMPDAAPETLQALADFLTARDRQAEEAERERIASYIEGVAARLPSSTPASYKTAYLDFAETIRTGKARGPA